MSKSNNLIHRVRTGTETVIAHLKYSATLYEQVSSIQYLAHNDPTHDAQHIISTHKQPQQRLHLIRKLTAISILPQCSHADIMCLPTNNLSDVNHSPINTNQHSQ